MSTQSTQCRAASGKTFQRTTTMSTLGCPWGRRSASQALARRGHRGYRGAGTHLEHDMADMPYKPDWIETVRRVVTPLLPQAMDEGTMVLQALSIYKHTDELGGRSLASVLRHLGDFRQAVDLETLPEEIEAHGWQLYLF